MKNAYGKTINPNTGNNLHGIDYDVIRRTEDRIRELIASLENIKPELTAPRRHTPAELARVAGVQARRDRAALAIERAIAEENRKINRENNKATQRRREWR